MSSNQKLGALILASLLGYSYLVSTPAKPVDPNCPGPVCPSPSPTPSPPKRPLIPRPWGDTPAIEAGSPQLGGFVSPDGKVTVVGDLPGTEKRRNVGGNDGAGLCVFTSVEYCARFQNEPRLVDFQTKMRRERGGGWPEKLDAMIAKYGPGTQYIQHTKGDTEFLRLVLKTGRLAGVTYGGYDPHYRGYVAHMVTLVYLGDEWACITDNNYPGENELVWMSVPEFERRWRLNGGGWAVALLNPPPSPRLLPGLSIDLTVR